MFLLNTKKLKIYLLTDGSISIDGGSLFGIVPKSIWSRYYHPDRKNRVLISLNCLLIETKRKKILIDTGIGNKFDKKFKRLYKITKDSDLLKSLKILGVRVDEINLVINTHLHFDHCGYNTILCNNIIEPTFKKAKYIIQKKEIEYAFSPDERSKHSYVKDNFEVLYQKKFFEIINGYCDIEKGVTIIPTSGHSSGHQSVLISNGYTKIFFTGDLVPMGINVKTNYTSAFDLFPKDLMEVRKNLILKAERDNWTLVLPHEDKSSSVSTTKQLKKLYFTKKQKL